MIIFFQMSQQIETMQNKRTNDILSAFIYVYYWFKTNYCSVFIHQMIENELEKRKYFNNEREEINNQMEEINDKQQINETEKHHYNNTIKMIKFK